MTKLHEITVGGNKVYARSGESVLDAALMGGADFPHDCRSGRCGTCIARVKSGITLGGEVPLRPDHVHACQALVFSDLELEVEERPPVVVTKGRVSKIVEVSDDTVEVVIDTQTPLDILPGQYCRFQFRGFPERAFSPTAPLNSIEIDSRRRIRLNVKRVDGGQVTPYFGTRIGMGYPVRVEGPFGSAFHRPNQSNRLVLVGSGTGFAPVWAIAVAALHEDPECSICLIGAARTFDSLYIMSALELAANFPNTSVVACVGDLDEPLDSIMPGSPLVHLPKDLGSDDIVYGAGGPSFIDVLGRICASSEASFFSDPFEPASPPRVSWTEKAKAWIAAI